MSGTHYQLYPRSGVLRRLQEACGRVGGPRNWALKHGLSPQYVYNASIGRVRAGPDILAALRIERVDMYRDGAPPKPTRIERDLIALRQVKTGDGRPAQSVMAARQAAREARKQQ
jgi:hypothetical protein